MTLLAISRERYDCVAFDLDGTLLNTRRDMISAVNRFLLKLGRPNVPGVSLADSIHHGMPAMLNRGLSLTGGVPDSEAFEQMVKDFLGDYAKHATMYTHAYPESVELLKQLRKSGFSLAVCTNKPEAITQKLLEHFQLFEFFQVIVGGDSLTACKPDPMPLHWIARRVDTSPSRILLVGDSAIDAQCADSAGAGLILMEHGYGADDVATDCTRMADFNMLRALL